VIRDLFVLGWKFIDGRGHETTKPNFHTNQKGTDQSIYMNSIATLHWSDQINGQSRVHSALHSQTSWHESTTPALSEELDSTMVIAKDGPHLWDQMSYIVKSVIAEQKTEGGDWLYEMMISSRPWFI